nr:MAG TPA: hypothetical protein [Caudoviricetes sp.]
MARMRCTGYRVLIPDIHRMLKKTLCSNRIAISAVKSEYVYTERETTTNGGTHHEKEHDLGSKSIDSNRAGQAGLDGFQNLQERRNCRRLDLRLLQKERLQHYGFQPGKKGGINHVGRRQHQGSEQHFPLLGQAL